MSHHFSKWQKQNVTIHVLLYSQLTAANWKLVCLRYYTIYTQQISTGSTTGFEFVNVYWGELSNLSLNHSIKKLIAIAWKDQMWRLVAYLFDNRMWGDLILESPVFMNLVQKASMAYLNRPWAWLQKWHFKIVLDQKLVKE